MQWHREDVPAKHLGSLHRHLNNNTPVNTEVLWGGGLSRLDELRAVRPNPQHDKQIDDTDTGSRLRKTGTEPDSLCALLALDSDQTCQSGSIAEDVQVRNVLATLGVNIATDGLSSASGDGNGMEPIGLEPTTSCMPCRRSPN